MNFIGDIKKELHDLCNSLNKAATLKVEGDLTQIGEDTLGNLNELISVLIFNSIHFGIETKDKRKSIGKDIRGLITLGFKKMNDCIVFSFKDDGNGFDFDGIKNKYEDLDIKIPNNFDESVKDGDVTETILRIGRDFKRLSFKADQNEKNLSYIPIFNELYNSKVKIKTEKGKGIFLEFTFKP